VRIGRGLVLRAPWPLWSSAIAAPSLLAPLLVALLPRSPRCLRDDARDDLNDARRRSVSETPCLELCLHRYAESIGIGVQLGIASVNLVCGVNELAVSEVEGA
jgi:hypothetical protein